PVKGPDLGHLPARPLWQWEGGESRIDGGAALRRCLKASPQLLPQGGWRRRDGEAREQGSARRAELGERGTAGGAGVEVPLHHHPVGEVGLAGGDRDEDLFGRVHGGQPPSRTTRRDLSPERMRDLRVPTGKSRRWAVSS